MSKHALAALLVATGCCRALHSHYPREDRPPDLPPVPPGDAVAFPAWLPADVRGDSSAGTTNVLGMTARWVVPPPWGRPGLVAVAYSNRTAQAFAARNTESPYERDGVLCFALGQDGGRQRLDGLPPYGISLPDSRLFAENQVLPSSFQLPPSMLAAAVGSKGALLAYAGRNDWNEVVFWAECAPLPVPNEARSAGVAGTNEWNHLREEWRLHGETPIACSVRRILLAYPEFAPFYPGVVCDASLPEAFRLEFAADMPSVDAYDPAVVTFVTNAVDKTAPLVIAALRVLSQMAGGSPEENAALDAAADAVHAMSLDAQHPMLFRAYAAQWFRSDTPYEDFMARTESHLKLLAVDDIRSAPGRFFPLAVRDNLRTGLTTLSTDTTPFVAGPMAGRYPENATVGQVATIILADLEAKWAAEPAREE